MRLTRKPKRHNETLSIAMYNVISSIKRLLEMVMRAMDKINVDLGFLTETKLTKYYTKSAFGYQIFSTKATSAYKGGAALFFRPKKDSWHVESVRDHVPNVISAVLISGYKLWIILGAYISPIEDNRHTICYIEEYSKRYDYPIILCGDLNVQIKIPARNRDIEIVSTLKDIGLIYVDNHFSSKSKFHHGNTWKSHDSSKSIFCEYILSS